MRYLFEIIKQWGVIEYRFSALAQAAISKNRHWQDSRLDGVSLV